MCTHLLGICPAAKKGRAPRLQHMQKLLYSIAVDLDNEVVIKISKKEYVLRFTKTHVMVLLGSEMARRTRCCVRQSKVFAEEDDEEM